MEFRTKPQDCSICRTMVYDDSLRLTEGCIWLCRKCKTFLEDLN